jgi:hypothetical protein
MKNKKNLLRYHLILTINECIGYIESECKSLNVSFEK